MKTRVLIGTCAVAGALALPSGASAQNCYGALVSAGGQNGGNGAFVSGSATSPEFKGSGNLTIGRDGVPFEKALACGG
ncbi:MAG: hypothetical protein QOF55_139 [Thermoleophilaceae bacterium]|nr:hypothetical protein [Thermoleophilaceae bacterium]